jgi:hypothetical protein
MVLIFYTIEFLALTYWWRMYYGSQYRLIAPQTFRKRSIISMSIALVAYIGIGII